MAALAGGRGAIGAVFALCALSLGSALADPPPGWWDGPNALSNMGGLRDQLTNQGITLGGTWTMEAFDNVHGGIEPGTVAASTLDLNAQFDLQKLAGLNDAEFYIDLEDHAGRDPDSVVGDLQTIDKLDGTPYVQIFELWYQQKFWSDKLRVKIGKIDANSEFSVIDNGLDFIDASTQVTPTLLGFTTTPDPQPSIDLFFNPSDLFYADFSVEDSNRADHFLDFQGHPQAINPTPNGQLYIGETGLTWKQAPMFGTDGNLRLGYWGHTGDFTRFNGTFQNGAQGFYAIVNQTLWRPTPESSRGVGAFLEYGQTNNQVSPIDRHYGAGLSFTGPIPAHAQDVMGVTAQYAHVSNFAGLAYHQELLAEGFYRIAANNWASLQPDLQYIQHPGGKYPDSLVGLLILQITL